MAAGLRSAPTCKRDWGATGGHRRDFMAGCPLAVAAVLSCTVQVDRWIALHLVFHHRLGDFIHRVVVHRGDDCSISSV